MREHNGRHYRTASNGLHKSMCMTTTYHKTQHDRELKTTENTTTIYWTGRLSAIATCTIPCLMRTPAQSHSLPNDCANAHQKITWVCMCPVPNIVEHYSGLLQPLTQWVFITASPLQTPSALQNTSWAPPSGARWRGQALNGPGRSTRCCSCQRRYRRTGPGCWRLCCSHRWRRRTCNSHTSPQTDITSQYCMRWTQYVPITKQCKGRTPSSVVFP